jgi:hypothetical protein
MKHALIALLLVGCFGTGGGEHADAGADAPDAGPWGWTWQCDCHEDCHVTTDEPPFVEPIYYCAPFDMVESLVRLAVEKQCDEYHDAPGPCHCAERGTQCRMLHQ